MESVSLSEISSNFDHLINQVSETNQPILLKGNSNEVIIISQENWSGIQETLYANSIRGYVDSIEEIIDTPKEELVNAKKIEENDWHNLALMNLNNAYDEDEVEYSLEEIKEFNTEYERM
ncbi:type II toxin-antitoxin system Phd/YefM family antitoxin [Geminocystis herdmanii]|uniref:type II toxin-antitoxin system Phd/YefM family antitoxin n=1 Tax=Geminocystis herdmanii TaxID=669359 RepID=UPI00034A92CE|nr:type II toxin-antitoxin system Phd/YefM family antitoxin [Geminocystis herdmanii]